jgi:hypothetical protein
MFNVRIRADETVRGLLPPVALRNLVVEPDRSPDASELAKHAPGERAAPIILVIVGALTLIQILEMIKEMVREYYYGGVLIDARKSPPNILNDLRIPANTLVLIQPDGTIGHFSVDSLPADLLETVLRAKK